MIDLLYRMGVWVYYTLARLFQFINPKARLWVDGQKNLFDRLDAFERNPQQKLLWFHCASLGEFEQARPVIEAVKETQPDTQIYLTFFSPSGYEVRKDYPMVDQVNYLPLDFPGKAQRFIQALQPDALLLAKYEFWPNMLRKVHDAGIDSYLFSAKFRPNQLFFKSYGKAYRRLLFNFTHIFLQDEQSARLLDGVHLQNYEVAGDTRFDRVAQVAAKPKAIPEIRDFIQNKTSFVVGSAWPEDMERLYALMEEKKDWKFIIAPHNIEEGFMSSIEERLSGDCIRHSRLQSTKEEQSTYQVLIVDAIGFLTSIYAEADFAFIGGAYVKGLHNTLEAAVYGIPLFFGDQNYRKFGEAMDLLELGAAQLIHQDEDLMDALAAFEQDTKLYQQKAKAAKSYVNSHLGATKKIMEKLKAADLLD